MDGHPPTPTGHWVTVRGGPPSPGLRLLGFCSRKPSERSGQCSALFLRKQILYMCINKTDRHYLFFIFFTTPLCSWFKFPSGNVTKCYTRSEWRKETRCALTWQVDSGGGLAGQRPLEGRGDRCHVLPLPGPPPSLTPRCLQLPWLFHPQY